MPFKPNTEETNALNFGGKHAPGASWSSVTESSASASDIQQWTDGDENSIYKPSKTSASTSNGKPDLTGDSEADNSGDGTLVSLSPPPGKWTPATTTSPCVMLRSRLPTAVELPSSHDALTFYSMFITDDIW